jgi:hypothetical protein
MQLSHKSERVNPLDVVLGHPTSTGNGVSPSRMSLKAETFPNAALPGIRRTVLQLIKFRLHRHGRSFASLTWDAECDVAIPRIRQPAAERLVFEGVSHKFTERTFVTGKVLKYSN